MNIRIFLQSEHLNDVEVVEVNKFINANELHKACAAVLPKETDSDSLLLFFEDDDEEPAAKNGDELPDGLRVHLHRLKAIDVVVRYAGRDVRRTFRPSTTINRVKRWSTHELGLSQCDAAELMLQIAGSDIRPDTDVHIGSLVKAPSHSITYDFVPAPRVNG